MTNNSRIYYSREAEELAHRQKRVRSLTLLAVGAGVGAVTTLMMSPDKTEKVRELMTSAFEEGFDRGRGSVTEAVDQLEKEYPKLRERVEKILDGIVS
ncbi:MAG: YtxH domain-containing protein [Anaerolineae bacterium]|nr:YtxH domain-containing protein [Anaerolineae bacterium]